MSVLYPKALQYPVPYTTKALTGSLGLILHVQQGNGSLAGYFANAANGAMSHWWVSKSGVVEQYKDAAFQSWAQAGGNATYHSVETEGYVNEPLNQAQIEALAGLYQWGMGFGWPAALAEAPGQKGFGWHGMGGTSWGNHPGCPGDLRKPQRQDVLDIINIPSGGTEEMTPIFQVTDGPFAGTQIYDYGKGPVHITGPESAELLKAPAVPIKKISGATYSSRFAGI